jgi:hypothetical protein
MGRAVEKAGEWERESTALARLARAGCRGGGARTEVEWVTGKVKSREDLKVDRTRARLWNAEVRRGGTQAPATKGKRAGV